MPNSVDVMLVSVSSRIVARIGKEAAAMVCRLITFSAMSTQVWKRVVIVISYHRRIALCRGVVII